jgi:hypothetical protein
VFLVGLHVLGKIDTAVRLVVDVLPSDDGMWAESRGDAVFVWEGIEPEDAQENHFEDDFGGVAHKRGRVMITSGSVLDGADASFDFGNVCVFAGDIESGMKVGLDVGDAGMNRVDFKSTLEVRLKDVADAFLKCRRCVIGKRFGRDEMDITRD